MTNLVFITNGYSKSKSKLKRKRKRKKGYYGKKK